MMISSPSVNLRTALASIVITFFTSGKLLATAFLCNAVAFIVSSDADSDGEVEEFTVTYNLKDGVTASNKRKTALEGSKFTTKLDGVEAGDTVTVTMGGSAVTGAYTDGKDYCQLDHRYHYHSRSW